MVFLCISDEFFENVPIQTNGLRTSLEKRLKYTNYEVS